MTGLVVISTGVWDDRVPTALGLDNVNISYVGVDEQGAYVPTGVPRELTVEDGYVLTPSNTDPRLAYYDVGVERLFTDEAMTQPFTGTIFPGEGRAEDATGNDYRVLHGEAVRSSAPLTTLAFERGLEGIGLSALGRYIVLISVFLFAISTAISWSYYGDRCANYLWGAKAILPYKMVYVLMHFVGATLAVTTIWDLGDVALSLVTLPNVLSLLLLSGVVKKLTDSYFERQPWRENYEVHKRVVEERKHRKPV
jgi:AGCS family alanine or glycine:cation symporter